MGMDTKIEWTDSTLNLMMGCDGCELWNLKTNTKHCYAGTLTELYGGRKGWPVTFGQPALFPERLKQALKWPDLTGKERSDKPALNGYPRTIFLDDMGDTFTESLPIDWLMPHIQAMADSPHIWQFLTKRPSRMYRFFSGLGYIPRNFWLMTSVTDQATTARIPQLLKLKRINPGAILGLSIEPLLGPVDIGRWLCCPWCGEGKKAIQDDEGTWYHRSEVSFTGGFPCPTPETGRGQAVNNISWVIVGGESGPQARPCHPDWVRGIRDGCTASGVAFFFKQWGQFTPCACDDPGTGCLRIWPDGKHTKVDAWRPGPHLQGSTGMHKVGKHAAGRILDGREWSEFPQVEERV